MTILYIGEFDFGKEWGIIFFNHVIYRRKIKK